MRTYQDFLEVGENEKERMAFIRAVIEEHKSTELYQNAVIAEQYDKHRNVTIMEYQKLLFTMTGETKVDIWNANYKLASKFFNRFIVQENQYLLGNGVTWKNGRGSDALGKDFDNRLQELGKMSLVGGVAFGFFNNGKVDCFAVTEFAPIYDEENGALMAGVRFWQVSDEKPLRATLYEMDGYTDYIFNKREYDGRDFKYTDLVLHDKRPYKLKVRTTEADGTEIYDGENYPGFPIVPLWGSPYHQSEIVGLREQIDCYDLIKSGYANNVDEGSLIYWTLQNAGGMDDMDLAQFVEKMKSIHAAATDTGVTAEPHNMEAPYQSREALLATLRADLYEDAMALDTKNIANGATTATQIKAAYEPLNSKTDQFEYCVIQFIDGILNIAGVEDEPSFTRSVIVNNSEELQQVLQAAQFLDEEYVTRKILNLLGDGDLADEILERKAADEIARAEAEEKMMAEIEEETEEAAEEGI